MVYEQLMNETLIENGYSKVDDFYQKKIGDMTISITNCYEKDYGKNMIRIRFVCNNKTILFTLTHAEFEEHGINYFENMAKTRFANCK